MAHRNHHLRGSASGDAGHEQLVSALSDTSFYPHRPDRVELRETHISWIFLAGELAYKLKKPITLPFLDYGTLERRRHLCHEEVVLNRRLAPDVYRGVRAVVRTDGGYRLAEADTPGAADYLVEMRRFREDRTLSQLLERDQVSPDRLAAVGARLARFHARAEQITFDPALLRSLRETVDSNVETLLDETVGSDHREGGEAQARPPIDPDDIAVAGRFSSAFLVAWRGQLLERARRGLWRDGHGDLRAEHVVLEGDDVEVVDCVEFDPALRRIDVGFDLAFLAMELEEIAGPAAAEALVNGYREAGGDPGGRALLSFYAAQRAWIRAKVTLLRAGQLENSERRRERAAAGDVFALGRQLAWRARLPLAIAVCGPPATGKTHLARALGEASGLPELSSDVVRKELAGLAATERAGPEHYTRSASERTYAELARRAAGAVRAGGGALVDATFRRAGARRTLARALEAAGARVVFVECRAPRELVLERAGARLGGDESVSDATPELAKRLGQEFEPLDELDGRSHLVVWTDRPTPELVREVETLLDR